MIKMMVYNEIIRTAIYLVDLMKIDIRLKTIFTEKSRLVYVKHLCINMIYSENISMKLKIFSDLESSILTKTDGVIFYPAGYQKIRSNISSGLRYFRQKQLNLKAFE